MAANPYVVGAPNEIKTHEYRVSMIPVGVEELTKAGCSVLIQSGAGLGSGISDAQYAEQGAEIVASAEDVWKNADLVVKVKEPLPVEWPLMRSGQVVFTYFHFAADEKLTRAVMASGVTAIAYETIKDARGNLPLLTPMSEVAGRMSIQEGAKYLERPFDGRGILLGGVPGVLPASVVILGGGVVGANAAKVAAGLGANVTILDVNLDRLRYLDDVMPRNVTTLYSDRHNIRDSLVRADLLIGAVLIPGARAPYLVKRADLKRMLPRAVIIDVAIDQGGCVETSHPTTHSQPTYIVDDVVHYCVTNMPGAVGRTSTYALTNVTLPYVLQLARKGFDKAIAENPALRQGVNIHQGKVTNPAVAATFGLECAASLKYSPPHRDASAMYPTTRRLAAAVTALLLVVAAVRADNLIADPSFEEPMPKDRFGHVFAHWSGWIYEGDCDFRVSDLAHTGKHSLLMFGSDKPKIRAWADKLALDPGRYRVTAYLRGLDVGTGVYGQTTEFMFAGKYMPLHKNGTFGWSKLTYVGEVKERGEATYPSFGLMAPGYFWVDDVSLEKVGDDVPLTPQPEIGPEEKAVAPPGELGANVVRCPDCGYRNDPSWGHCYACGAALEGGKAEPSGPPVKVIASFEDRNPFDGAAVVAEHATDGKKALRIDKGFAAMDGPQSWAGYDYLKADVYTDAKDPVEFSIEVRDRETRDYWTRVNYTTVVPPGASTLIVPTALYVGEKARPGRPLMKEAVTRLVFIVGDKPQAPLFLDNVRLERDTETAKVLFDGLYAFDVGPAGSPLMDGFTPLDPGKTYAKGRGYGWKDAHFWRGFDALQPDPLYEDFLCVEHGGLAIDVPNGKYHVFVNMDSPSGYWGEFQRYRKRALILNGERHEDTMDLASFKKRYYRNWDREDFPSENTFDTYQIPYFSEKEYDVEVRDGRLDIDFEGENWACCVSAIVVYPEAKAEQGRKFLDFVKARRRFHFDNAFKRVLPRPTGEAPKPTAEENERGFVAFHRDWMQDVNVNDRPLPGETVTQLNGSAFAGEYEPVTLSLLALHDLGKATLTATDLRGPGASIPSSSIDVGYVQYRVKRVTAEGSVYTIAPRLIIPEATAAAPEGVARTFWLTVKTPADAPAGVYHGEVRVAAEHGGALTLPLTFTVRKGTLDPVDVPAGPFSHTIDLPWFEDEAAGWNADMAMKSLKKLREYGFTTATGLPVVAYHGFKDGKPQLDFSAGDAQMKRFKEAGFTMPVVSYCAFNDLNTYYRDEEAMKAAGFSDYSAFIKAIFTAVQKHADEAGWLPVYWNIADEPTGDDVTRSAVNAEAYRQAFPQGPPWFTGASSFSGTDIKDPHYRLAKALHSVAWNLHDKEGVKLLHDAGCDWGFYNGGNRWTYGVYMYKAAKEYGMKFRVSWHWNAVAGDPYYALDCREDDYAWCNSSPDGRLIPAVEFERLREGLGDYRRLLTLARLAKEKAGTPAAREAEKVMAQILGGFELGQREPKSVAEYAEIRARLDDAIEKLR